MQDRWHHHICPLILFLEDNLSIMWKYIARYHLNIAIVIVVVVLPFLAYKIVDWYELRYDQLPVMGTIDTEKKGIKKYHHLPYFELVNQDSMTYTLNNLKNKIVVADFFFTSCPSICPKMTNHLKEVNKAYANEQTIQIISFTVDPKHDTPYKLRLYRRAFEIPATNNWQFLTGKKDKIYWLARKGFLVTASDVDGDEEDFIHSEKLVLLDIQQRIRGYYDGTNISEVKRLIQDIKKLKYESRAFNF